MVKQALKYVDRFWVLRACQRLDTFALCAPQRLVSLDQPPLPLFRAAKP